MKLGIGIDTGGTYTDAVIYDFESNSVLSSGKALTTKHDLSIGIGNVLDALDQELLRRAKVISLSTTLATNACVEGKGGRAKLLFIGVDRGTIERVGKSYGFRNNGELYCLEAEGSFDGSVVPSPDWDRLLSDTEEWLKDAEGLGIVERYATKNGAAVEKTAKQLFSERYDIPVVTGSELFSGLNSVQRGSGTLLNARLVPIIRDFLVSIKKALARRNISAPVIIVRSDGSLMSEEASVLRPVETILCGPASSVMGGMKLSGRGDCVIIDMGGTTTDVSLVKDGIPVKAHNGISIGGWKTFVRGVYIDTFGLGGDSAIMPQSGSLVIDTRRVIPISLLAQNHPEILDELEELLKSKAGHTKPIYEYYCLVRDISENGSYTENERAFCRALKDKPLILKQAAEAAGTDIYRLDMERLEDEGVVLRAGLTPTDIMHIKGDFSSYSTKGAELAARYVMKCLGLDDGDEGELMKFCDMVYDKVKLKLYSNLVRILLCDKYPGILRDGPDAQLEELILKSWEDAKRGETPYFSLLFKTRAALVGIGAPIHIFLPDVAKALGTECVIPENAGVANAAGAIMGNITVTAQVEVHPNYTPGGITGYTVYSASSNHTTKRKDDALKIALDEAKKQALDEAEKRGIAGDIRLDTEIVSLTGTAANDMTLDLGNRVIATAIGGIVL